jgi:hypothetical protein
MVALEQPMSKIRELKDEGRGCVEVGPEVLVGGGGVVRAQLGLASERAGQGVIANIYSPTLPLTITTLMDILNLPIPWQLIYQ